MDPSITTYADGFNFKNVYWGWEGCRPTPGYNDSMADPLTTVNRDTLGCDNSAGSTTNPSAAAGADGFSFNKVYWGWEGGQPTTGYNGSMAISSATVDRDDFDFGQFDGSTNRSKTADADGFNFNNVDWGWRYPQANMLGWFRDRANGESQQRQV
ncbi:MAG: hypothetical protein Q9198_010530 [Flavoplaca austrocitrina]